MLVVYFAVFLIHQSRTIVLLVTDVILLVSYMLELILADVLGAKMLRKLIAKNTVMINNNNKMNCNKFLNSLLRQVI